MSNVRTTWKSLEIARSTISMHFKALGIIQKQRNWVLYELKPRDLEKRFFTCKQLLQQQNGKIFSIVSL